MIISEFQLCVGNGIIMGKSKKVGHGDSVIRFDCDSILGMNHLWGNEGFSPARSKSRHNSVIRGKKGENIYIIKREKK